MYVCIYMYMSFLANACIPIYAYTHTIPLSGWDAAAKVNFFLTSQKIRNHKTAKKFPNICADYS